MEANQLDKLKHALQVLDSVVQEIQLGAVSRSDKEVQTNIEEELTSPTATKSGDREVQTSDKSVQTNNLETLNVQIDRQTSDSSAPSSGKTEQTEMISIEVQTSGKGTTTANKLGVHSNKTSMLHPEYCCHTVQKDDCTCRFKAKRRASDTGLQENIIREFHNASEGDGKIFWIREYKSEKIAEGDSLQTYPKHIFAVGSEIPNPVETSHDVFQKLQRRKFICELTNEQKQYCMQKSLRKNIVELVEKLPFTETDLYDTLIEKECLTETECDDLRRFGRKDQVRNLVRIIMKKPYKELKIFLSCVERLHPQVAAILEKDYEKFIVEKPEQIFRCSLCKVKDCVDIKKLADRLLSQFLISDEIYGDIVTQTATNTNASWEILFDELRVSPNAEKATRVIMQVLGERRQSHLLEFRTFSMFRCYCETTRTIIPIKRQESLSDASSHIPASTSRSATDSCDSLDQFSLEIQTAQYSASSNMFEDLFFPCLQTKVRQSLQNVLAAFSETATPHIPKS